MKSEIEIFIDDKKIICQQGKTILEAALENGIEIPTLCFHSDLGIKASCRICAVKVEGKKNFYMACSTVAENGMKITTDSLEIRKSRKTNLELIFSQHCEECGDCVSRFDCRLLDLADKYGAKITRFQDRKKKFPVYKFGPALIFDSSKCIDCRNCIEVCDKQGVEFLKIKKKGNFFQVCPSKEKNKNCVYCGQCIIHCPAGAFEAVGEFEEIEKPFKKKNKKIIFQFAPSIRTTIGEEFGFEPGLDITGKLVAGIKKLGANKVFDVSVGADFTTMEEGSELIERMNGFGKLPLITSCCPAWVRFVEIYFPEFIPNLASTRPPHVILGGLVKTFWAKKENIKPKNIIVVSIMPCVSKKYEIKRKELKIGDFFPVDFVLTTRELSRLFLKNKINLKKIEPQGPDSPFSEPSGSGLIYGASGGVMESALRLVCMDLTGIILPEIDYGKSGSLKEAEVKIGNKKIRIAVANGLGAGRKILEKLKNNPGLYDYIEVMACPGGCIGGGGQPLPTEEKLRTKRVEGLRSADKNKIIRTAGKNPVVKEIYENFLNSKEIVKKICHTGYSRKKK